MGGVCGWACADLLATLDRFILVIWCLICICFNLKILWALSISLQVELWTPFQDQAWWPNWLGISLNIYTNSRLNMWNSNCYIDLKLNVFKILQCALSLWMGGFVFKGGITVREEKYFLAIVWGPSYLMGSPYTSNLYVCFVRPWQMMSNLSNPVKEFWPCRAGDVARVWHWAPMYWDWCQE